MKPTRHFAVVPESALALALTLAAGTAQAQFVQGNEAVSYSLSGAKQAETPPITESAARTAPYPAAAYGSYWLMVETPSGLAECTEPYARPRACRSSSYGTAKLSRVWVVKVNGKWLQCQFPDIKSKCVEMFERLPANLPFPALQ